MAAQALQPVESSLAPGIVRLPPVPWRDPNTVSPKALAGYISQLELACAENPGNADLRTCLGMAHAMNYDVYRSMDALEEARSLEPGNFFAQLKYAELYYRLRAIEKAEREAIQALELAGNNWELSLARKLLADIRTIKRSGTQKPEWTKSLKVPAITLSLMFVATCILMIWK